MRWLIFGLKWLILGLRRLSFEPERTDFGPERADFGPERADFEPERADFRPERGLGGGRTDGRTDGRTEKTEKISLCGDAIGHRPLQGRCPKVSSYTFVLLEKTKDYLTFLTKFSLFR